MCVCAYNGAYNDGLMCVCAHLSIGHLYGLEKFWAFLKYYKGHQPLDISPELTKRLSTFKTLEDFRVAASADVS